MEFKNPVFNAFGGINCEVNHPEFGWIPFTANEDDCEEHGREIFRLALPSAAPYVPPSEEEQLALARQRMVALAPQVKMALAQIGRYDEAEVAIASADQVTQVAWKELREFKRLSPVIVTLGTALSMTEGELDDLFHVAMTMEV